jgi:hypothetical protein
MDIERVRIGDEAFQVEREIDGPAANDAGATV